jgi:hypothetical protein
MQLNGRGFLSETHHGISLVDSILAHTGMEWNEPIPGSQEDMKEVLWCSMYGKSMIIQIIIV